MAVRVEREDGEAVCERCEVADTPLSRLKGLLGRARLDNGEALLIRPASSIHTFFMRFPIDVVFVDRSLRIVGVSPNVAPWRIAARRRAHAVFELAAGECETRGIEPGTTLRVVPNGSPYAGPTG